MEGDKLAFALLGGISLMLLILLGGCIVEGCSSKSSSSSESSSEDTERYYDAYYDPMI